MTVNVLLCSCCMLLPCKTFFYVCFLDVVFFSCTVTVFFCFPRAKLVIHFFLIVSFALCTVFWYVLCTIICVFVCIFFGFLLFCVQSPACLIFWNGFAHCFVHFSCQNPHFYTFCFCRFFAVPLPRFFGLSGWAVCLFLCCTVFLLAMLCYDVLFVLFHLFLLIFWLISCGCFFYIFCLAYRIWICCFWWGFALVHIFCLLLVWHRHTKLRRTPFFAGISITWSCLTTSTIPANFLFCFHPDIHQKIRATRSFLLLFRLFFVPPVSLLPNASKRTHMCPPTPMKTHMRQTLKNVMSGEISPAIWPEIYPEQPFFALLDLFLCPPMLPAPPTHQYTPIRTLLHPYSPSAPCIYVLYM